LQDEAVPDFKFYFLLHRANIGGGNGDGLNRSRLVKLDFEEWALKPIILQESGDSGLLDN